MVEGCRDGEEWIGIGEMVPWWVDHRLRTVLINGDEHEHARKESLKESSSLKKIVSLQASSCY